MRPSPTRPVGLLAVVVLSACSTAGTSPAPPAPATTASSAPAPRSPSAPAEDAPPVGATVDAAEGTVVRFSTPEAFVDVTLDPRTPTTVDLVSLLPFTMRLEEFSGRKIGDPPRELDVEGTAGSDPVDGDLICFTPWGDLGFSYDAPGIEHSDDTPHLGTYEATEEQLSRLEGEEVTVALLEP